MLSPTFHARRAPIPWCAAAFLSLIQTPLHADPPPRAITLQQIEHLCELSPTPACQIDLDTPWQTDLPADARLPRPILLRVSPHGSWTIHGSTLDLHGSTIDAAPDRQIFAGTAHLHGLTSARPEWFSQPVQGVYPASALALAVQATDRTGTILLLDHTYLSPFFDPEALNTCTGRTLPLDRPLAILGTRRPLPDDEHAPTRLQNGTIIRGEICGTSQLHLAHLGVDEGPYAVAHDFNGHAAYGIQVLKLGPLGAVQNTILEDLSILTTGLTNQHSVIVEGQRHATLKDLWVWTLGGAHGLVVKSLDTLVENLHCTGASSDCLIFKSDFDTDHAGDASRSIASNVFIHSLLHPGDTAGIALEGKWDSLRNLTLTNIHESGLGYGIVGGDSLFHQLANVKISNWSATNMQGPCLALYSGNKIEVTHFECALAPSRPIPGILLGGTEIFLSDGQITCSGPACTNPTLDGVTDRGRHNRIDHVSASNLGGFLVRTSPHLGGTLLNSVNTRQMGNRTSSIFQEQAASLPQHLRHWLLSLKPELRIAWEKARNLLHLR